MLLLASFVSKLVNHSLHIEFFKHSEWIRTRGHFLLITAIWLFSIILQSKGSLQATIFDQLKQGILYSCAIRWAESAGKKMVARNLTLLQIFTVLDPFGSKRCQKKCKDVDYKLLQDFFQKYFVVFGLLAVKNLFSIWYVFYPLVYFDWIFRYKMDAYFALKRHFLCSRNISKMSLFHIYGLR